MSDENDERIGFRHSPLLRGITIMDALHTSRSWRVVNPTFALAVPRDWIGDLQYRGQRMVMGQGDVFCTEPGEVHTTAKILQPGTFNVLMIDDEALEECVAHLAPHIRTVAWRKVGSRMSWRAAQRLESVFQVVGSSASPLYVQSAMVEAYDVIVEELLDNARPGRLRSSRWSPALERARECLHDEQQVDLATLAQKAGMSRFQLVRAFKERYGLPPHAYSVALRISRAVNLLRTGMRPSHVAAECGFADQSHFNRHLKRTLGVTSGQLSRGSPARTF